MQSRGDAEAKMNSNVATVERRDRVDAAPAPSKEGVSANGRIEAPPLTVVVGDGPEVITNASPWREGTSGWTPEPVRVAPAPVAVPRVEDVLERARALAHDLEALATLQSHWPSYVRLALAHTLSAVDQLENAEREGFRVTLPSPLKATAAPRR